MKALLENLDQDLQTLMEAVNVKTALKDSVKNETLLILINIQQVRLLQTISQQLDQCTMEARNR